jgi:hypothetical protein
VSTVKRQDSRFYVSPDDHAIKVPGVTSILNMLGKPFLQRWSAKVAAETAVDNLGTVVQLTLADRQAAIDYIKNAPYRDTQQAAATGTAAHSIFERMAMGKSPGRVTPDLEPYVRGFQAFLDDKQPEYIHLEETVWSDTHAYAGSFDAYAIVDGQRLFLDNKTTRSGAHEEAGIQLAAYRYSESIIRNDGTRVPTPKADGAAVLHIRPEGARLIPVKADEAMFEIFLALREAFRFEKEMKADVLGDPVWSYGYDEDEATGPKRRVPRAKRTAAS